VRSELLYSDVYWLEMVIADKRGLMDVVGRLWDKGMCCVDSLFWIKLADWLLDEDACDVFDSWTVEVAPEGVSWTVQEVRESGNREEEVWGVLGMTDAAKGTDDEGVIEKSSDWTEQEIEGGAESEVNKLILFSS
jgi:hypothetical protein